MFFLNLRKLQKISQANQQTNDPSSYLGAKKATFNSCVVTYFQFCTAALNNFRTIYTASKKSSHPY